MRLKNSFGLYLVTVLLFLKVNNGCNDGWLEYRNYCYLFQNQTLQGKSWRDALLSCQAVGAHLLSIEDQPENDFILKILLDDNMQKDNYWIGLNDAYNNREYLWLDNTYPQFSNWFENNPDNSNGDGGENCVATDTRGWNDKDCVFENFGCICKSVKVNNDCAGDWKSYKDYCYFFQKKTNKKHYWEECYYLCCNKGGNLLSVKDQEENEFVKSVLDIMKKNNGFVDDYFWIGLNYRKSHKMFEWSDNSPWNPKVTTENLINQRGNLSMDNAGCVVINANSWNVQDCLECKNLYICKAKRESNKSCSNGWFEYASYCYYFQIANNAYKRTWKESVSACLELGGNLLSVDSQAENKFILNILEKYNMSKENYWIGLTDKMSRSLFMWSDNTYFGYANFGYSLDNAFKCVRTDQTYWKIKDCSDSNGFICKIRRDLCTKNWRKYGRHCYFIQDSKNSVGSTWDEAFLDCQSKGGNLVSIEDDKEDQFVRGLIKDSGDYWIGLNRLRDYRLRSRFNWNYRKFVWSDNTYSQFFSWISNKPNDIYINNYDKSCVEIDSNGWTVNKCNALNAFICKANKVSSASIPANLLPISLPTNILPTSPPTNTSSSSLPASVSSTPLPTNKKSLIFVAILVPVLIVLIAVIIIVVILLCCKNGSKKSKMNLDPSILELYTEYDKSLVDKWEISPQNIIFDKKIGEGAFGTVYIAKLNSSVSSEKKSLNKKSKTSLDIREDSSQVAVKLVKDSADSSELNDFNEEMKLMKEIGYHKNIVNLIGCSTIKKPLCLVVEYMEHGDLLHYLRKGRTNFCPSKVEYQKRISAVKTKTTMEDYLSGVKPNEISLEKYEVLKPDDLLSFAWQIASGMEYLSSSKLVHRDLAARNILVGTRKIIKISDFGLSRKVNDELNYMGKKKRRLPVKWMSVEAIFDQMFTSFSDVWAYGVVLFEIVTLGGAPYPTISNRELLPLLKSGYRMERPENCSEAMYNIMMQCWNTDPLKRPTFKILRKHFDAVISQGDSYFNFDDEYTAPFFTPFETGDDGCTAEDEILQNLLRKVN